MQQYQEFFWTQSTSACKILPITSSKTTCVGKARFLLQERQNRYRHSQVQQMKKRVQAASAPQGCQICFFDAKLHKSDFFRDSWRQQIVCFVLNIWLFLESVDTSYQIGVFAFKYLANSVIRIFQTVLGVFLKRYLATPYRRIKMSHIWQPIMPKVRVENVEDE